MFLQQLIKIAAVALAIFSGISASAATKFTIPTNDGEYIDLRWADVEGANVEGAPGPDQCFGSTGENTVVTFSFENTVEQPYTFTMATGHKGTCVIDVTLKDASGTTVASGKHNVVNTQSWARTTAFKMLIENPLPKGDYTLELRPSNLAGSNYAGNWGKMAFYAGIVDNRDHVPGAVSLGKGNYVGMRTENNDGNVGYVKNNTSGSYDLVFDQPGVYDLNWGVTRYGDGVATISVIDPDGNVSAEGKWTVGQQTNYDPVTVHLGGEVAKGANTLKILFNADHTGFIANFNNIELNRVADHYACVRNVAIDGQKITAGDGYDLNCNLPISYSAGNVDFTFDHPNGSVVVTARKGDADVAVTEAGGKYSFPAPARNEEVIVTMTLTPDEGSVVAYQTVYTMRVFHIGDIILSELNLDGNPADKELFDKMSAAPYSTTLNRVYTHVPTLQARFIHGQDENVTPVKVSDNVYRYDFKAVVEDLSRDYSLTIDGIHLYDRLDSDETVAMKFNEGTYDETTKTWTNGQFSISGIDGGWNSEFKFPITAEQTYTINVGPDAVVKQLIFKGFRDNYTGNTNIIKAVTSGDAIVWLPGDNRFYNTSEAGVRDLVVNIEGHKVGTPISFTIQSNGQMMSEFEFTVGREAITSAPVLTSHKVIIPDNANHFVLAANFDRVIAKATATVGGQTITAVGGSDLIYFPAWNLDYDTDYTMTVTEAVDNYGNKLAAPVTCQVKTGSKAAVTKAPVDYIVSNVEEFKAMVAAVNASNASADAPAVVVFVKNGDYDFGTEEQTFRCYNVTLIGESRAGVILHGNRSGISNPVISTRYSNNTVLQDMTLRNDLDWGMPRGGVGVALSSGNREVGINLSLESQQDTQVTNGNQSYYRDCDIYGAVDYICGGGNQFYDRCNLIMTNPGTITAPSTSVAHKWGYVFSNCVINEISKGAAGSYNLARPWQNEPRTYWLNTKMNVLPTANGYGSMGNLPTHFYEYGSVDSEGNPIDLSVRGNSSTHVGPAYTPVLTDEQAALFTVENVLGQTDSYCVAEIATPLDAPAAKLAGKTISWEPVADARFYIVYRDGAYVANTVDNKIDADADGLYTVRAANFRGVLGTASAGVQVGESGLEDIVTGANEVIDITYYNLQGIAVQAPDNGVFIRVSRMADGTKTIEKIVK